MATLDLLFGMDRAVTLVEGPAQGNQGRILTEVVDAQFRAERAGDRRIGQVFNEAVDAQPAVFLLVRKKARPCVLRKITTQLVRRAGGQLPARDEKVERLVTDKGVGAIQPRRIEQRRRVFFGNNGRHGRTR